MPKIVAIAAAALTAAMFVRAETIAFYDFCGGDAGLEVGTFENSAGDGSFPATAKRYYDLPACALPKYAADSPGPIVVSSRDDTVLSASPQSLAFRYPSRSQTHLAGMVDVEGVAGRIVGKGDFTVECFVKMDEGYLYYQEGDGNYDQICKTVLYLQANAGQGAFKLMAPRYRFANGHAQGFGLQVYGRSGVVASGELASWADTSDGLWHHLAAVYTETDSQAQSGKMAFYVDYSLVGSVDYVNESTADEGLKLRIGSGYLNGSGVDYSYESINASVAGLRVSSGALAVEDFIATAAGRTVFRFTFDEGGDGERVVSAAEANGFKAMDTADLYGLFADDAPLYDRRDVAQGKSLVGRTVLDCGVRRTNAAVCHFRGYEAIAQGTANRQYAGHEVCVKGSSMPVANPDSWTMEAFVKVEFAFGDALIFGKYGNDKPHQNTSPKYCWMLTHYDGGRLKLAWQEASGGAGEAQTDRNCLMDCRWHHVALTYDCSRRQFRLYLDYESVLTAEVGESGLRDGPYGYYFSRMEPTSGFQGWMDEIRFSSSALPVGALLRLRPLGFAMILR